MVKVSKNIRKSKEMKHIDLPKLLKCSVSIENHFARGRLVWAKMKTYCWWPGVIISKEDCGFANEDIKNHSFYIYWFGDHKVSQVPAYSIKDFLSNFSLMDKICSRKRYKLAVYEVLREASLRLYPEIVNHHYQSLLSWADNNFHPRQNSQKIHTLSDKIIHRLKCIKQYFHQNQKKMEEAKVVAGIRKQGQASKRVRRGQATFFEMCISCDNASAKIVEEHPLFNGGLCSECVPIVNHVANNLPPGKFHGLCIICGQGGRLVICSLTRCSRSYCRQCIECLVSPETYKVILKTKPWICYLCQPYKSSEHGLIWKKTTLKPQEKNLKKPPCPLEENFVIKRPINVFSFNDTGKIILDKLKISTGKYYILCPPRNPDPLITTCDTEFVGNIKKIETSKINSMLPVDLVIGLTLKASLVITDQKSKATGEIGHMFYQFYRMLTCIEQKALAEDKEPNVFWIFISEITMTSKYKNVASRFLNCDPLIMTIRLNQAYYVWTNLPNATSIAYEISDKADISLYTPVTLEPDMAQKDEEDILEAFLLPLKKYFHLFG